MIPNSGIIDFYLLCGRDVTATLRISVTSSSGVKERRLAAEMLDGEKGWEIGARRGVWRSGVA